LGYPPAGDSALFNRNIRISDVVDDGPRVGVARDKGGTDTISGYALSLKIGCVACSVDNYRTNRPDGFLDVLASDGLAISNVIATYDSGFLNNLFPGWRFPSVPYKNLTFENITINDLASSSAQPPIGGSNQASNDGIMIHNVRVSINRWSGKGRVSPTFAGQGIDVLLDYSVTEDASRLVSLQKGTIYMTLQAKPANVQVGNLTTIQWITKGATMCSPTGAWSGDLATGAGSRSVKLSAAGSYSFTLDCQDAGSSAKATLPVAVMP
jgi:hypothetical protein